MFPILFQPVMLSLMRAYEGNSGMDHLGLFRNLALLESQRGKPQKSVIMKPSRHVVLSGCFHMLKLFFQVELRGEFLDLRRSPLERSLAIWLVGATYPSEKYEFVNWDDDILNMWKNRTCSKPPTRLIFLGCPNVFCQEAVGPLCVLHLQH